MPHAILIVASVGTPDDAKVLEVAQVSSSKPVLSVSLPDGNGFFHGMGSEGKATNLIALSECDLSPNLEDAGKAEAFWHGAVEGDGTMSSSLLALMRMDDDKRASYLRRYGTMDRYVDEMSRLHGDAFLSPEGEWADCLSLRGRNQLHEWNVGFVDRHILPLLPRQDASDIMLAAYDLALG